jgi:Ni/Co efflux regulator RcnB
MSYLCADVLLKYERSEVPGAILIFGHQWSDNMKHALRLGVSLAAAVVLVSGAIGAEEHNAARAPAPRAVARPAEPHPGPSGYQRVTEPKGWNARPPTVDRPTYQHNYQAARSYRIGPYHRPAGWVARRWGYGDILPRAYWASSYIIGDYWLFALEVPPAGYEWVREGDDALLIDVNTGEVLQAEYSVFA